MPLKCFSTIGRMLVSFRSGFESDDLDKPIYSILLKIWAGSLNVWSAS